MRSREKEIYDELNSHYPDDISFLHADTPFAFLVTVMLSASSTDKRAQAASDTLFSMFPDEKALARANVDEVESIIHQVGLGHTKASNIVALSRIIDDLGYIPDSIPELTKLPGIGEKTASCYLAHILDKPAVIADIHFMRVASRLGLIDTDNRERATREIRRAFDEDMWTRLSMTINIHGRIICRPKPKCRECFLSNLCSYIA